MVSLGARVSIDYNLLVRWPNAAITNTNRKEGERGMAVPLSQMATVTKYVLTQKLNRVKRYPLVLMLEPLFRAIWPVPAVERFNTRIMCWISGSRLSSAGRRRRNAALRSSVFPVANQ